MTRDSQVVWRYLNPVTDSLRLFQGDTIPDGAADKQNSTFRVTRYAPDYPGFAGKDLTPGYPLERYGSPTVGIAGPAKQPSRPRVALTVRPNPARTGTAISFQFTANSPAQVTVYDAAGRRVRSIAVPQSPAANRCSLSWDCRGVSVPPGVYICRLTTVGGSATQKLVMTE